MADAESEMKMTLAPVELVTPVKDNVTQTAEQK